LLADDLQVPRQALRPFLSREGPMHLVAWAVDGPHAVELARGLEPETRYRPLLYARPGFPKRLPSGITLMNIASFHLN
jgi:hypothetical protein